MTDPTPPDDGVTDPTPVDEPTDTAPVYFGRRTITAEGVQIAVNICSTCGALVPDQTIDLHNTWHAPPSTTTADQ